MNTGARQACLPDLLSVTIVVSRFPSLNAADTRV